MYNFGHITNMLMASSDVTGTACPATPLLSALCQSAKPNTGGSLATGNYSEWQLTTDLLLDPKRASRLG